MANKTLEQLSALAAADASAADLLLAWDTSAAHSQKTKSVRFDVLMGALDRLKGYHVVTDPKYGGDGTGASNSYNALNDAAQAAASETSGRGVLVIPPHAIVRTDTAVPLPENINVLLLGTVKAGAAMASVFQTPLSTRADDRLITGGGVIDGNDLADWGVQVRYAAHYAVKDLNFSRTRLGYVKAGDSGAPSHCYEVNLSDLHGLRDDDYSVVAGSQGFWFARASDSSMKSCAAIGMETGIRNDSDQNRFIDLHAWAYQASGWMVTAFDDNGSGGTWVACEADTPETYGFRCRQFNTSIVGGTVYNNSFYGQDNVITGVRFDQTSPFSSIAGLTYSAASGGHRILKDIDVNGSDFSTLDISGQKWAGTVTNITRNRARSLDCNSVKIGSSGTALTQMRAYTLNITPTLFSTTTSEQTFTCTGLTTADKLTVNPPGLATGVGIASVRVWSADTIAIKFNNHTGGSVTPAAGNYEVLAFRT